MTTRQPRGQAALPAERIERRIFFLRSANVMISTDLAALYGVEPRALVQAVKRNIARFPRDFMFQLSKAEFSDLKSQIVTSSWGGLRRATPYAFTEHGVAMLSNVLRSPRAIRVSIEIIRAFVRLRGAATSVVALEQKIRVLEQKYDGQFKMVFDAIRDLMELPPTPPSPPIGFRPQEGE